MGAIPVILITAFWGFVGIALPILAPKGPNRGIVQCVLMLTAATCWLFWLCCFMAQMNPLMGPRLHQGTILMVAREWGNMPSDIITYQPTGPPSSEH
ncbi:V-type proton ATPase subunit e-like [Sitodiplosis mosellana]|uniref:V-type proton ATPase subunit e-like n=1 Tax=Sitodiplosis mosellana TaxID=263140 RepID=UPI0024448A91|nr:V-type proton ATPase subunit e-like [Sitodiplosis mosellana]XP_055321183.1 V-type proton ATPase subunit e-like [Sitodiplosis mosellana]